MICSGRNQITGYLGPRRRRTKCKRAQGLFRGDGNVSYVIVVVVTWLHTFICETHRILYLKQMYFVVCKLYLNKVDLTKIFKSIFPELFRHVLFSSKQFQDSFNIMIIALSIKNVFISTVCVNTLSDDDNTISHILLNYCSCYLVNIFFSICLV